MRARQEVGEGRKSEGSALARRFSTSPSLSSMYRDDDAERSADAEKREQLDQARELTVMNSIQFIRAVML